MRSLGVHSVYVLDDLDPFASAARDDRGRQGPGRRDPRAGPRKRLHDPGEQLRKARRNDHRQRRGRGLHGRRRATPRAPACGGNCTAPIRSLKLLADSAMTSGPFASHLGPAATGTYLTTPLLSSASYPPQAQRVLDDYRREFGSSAGPWALDGYATMRMVLDAIDSAGHDATDRRTVIARLLGAPPQESVLGPLAIHSNGESTPLQLRRGHGQQRQRRSSCARCRCPRAPSRPAADRPARRAAVAAAQLAGAGEADDQLHALDAPAELARAAAHHRGGLAGRSSAESCSFRSAPGLPAGPAGSAPRRSATAGCLPRGRARRRWRVRCRRASTGDSAPSTPSSPRARSRSSACPVEFVPEAITTGSGSPERPTDAAVSAPGTVAAETVAPWPAQLRGELADGGLRAGRVGGHDHDPRPQFEQPRPGGEHARRPHPAGVVGVRLGGVGGELLAAGSAAPSAALRGRPTAAPMSRPRTSFHRRSTRAASRGARGWR